MNNLLKISFFLSALFLFVGCKDKEVAPATRSFYLGVTPWPADFTIEEVDKSYQFINEHCDIVSQHFDEGIPYKEAFANSNWPAGLLNDLHYRKIKTAPGKKIFLSSSALMLNRKTKAAYSTYSTSTTAAEKTQWERLPFNDPTIVTAYSNFLKLLIDSLQPSFINYGVESNLDSWSADSFFLYKDFISKVYLQLKATNPGIPVFVSFMVNEAPQSINIARQLLPYTDYIALSAYPYTGVTSSANGNTDPALFPADYFTKYLDLDNTKPFCFAETGYIAEPLLIPAFNLNKQGTAQWQNDYLQKICNFTNERKGKFIVWFCHKDYDAAVVRLQATGQYQDLFALWTNIGLIDENNVQRPVYTTWLNWMNRKLLP